MACNTAASDYRGWLSLAMTNPPGMKIIAESAYNHNGSLDYLKGLALASRDSGADYFTVQMMNVSAFCVENYERYALYTRTEFSPDQWKELFHYCESIGMPCIPCVLDEPSFLLAYECGFRLIKLHATDIVNRPFLELINRHDVRVLLETQCATVFEIQFALSILDSQKIEALFTGFSNYPTEVEELNLDVLDFFRETYPFKRGMADHSLDITHIPLMVLAKRADYLEKHITLSRNDRHPDWQVSLYPSEFAAMVHLIRHYEKALGTGVKHPVAGEKRFRNVLYKKHVEGQPAQKRADTGVTLIEHTIGTFDPARAAVALIARLKSQRLKQKVLLPFLQNELIIDLHRRVSSAQRIASTVLGTSYLPEDKPLADLFRSKGLPVEEGSPESVIDRMISIAFREKAGCIFRVTGDNPFTDPVLIDKMVDLLVEHDLDYVRINNAPFGVPAELFSTRYLWRLYLEMDNPHVSEYLTWFVLLDETCRVGSIDLHYDQDIPLVNFSVDYQEDYDRCQALLKSIGKTDVTAITLRDIVAHLDQVERVDDTKESKLPGGVLMPMREYIDRWNNRPYAVRTRMKI